MGDYKANNLLLKATLNIYPLTKIHSFKLSQYYLVSSPSQKKFLALHLDVAQFDETKNHIHR